MKVRERGKYKGTTRPPASEDRKHGDFDTFFTGRGRKKKKKKKYALNKVSPRWQKFEHQYVSTKLLTVVT